MVCGLLSSVESDIGLVEISYQPPSFIRNCEEDVDQINIDDQVFCAFFGLAKLIVQENFGILPETSSRIVEEEAQAYHQ